MTGPGAGYHPDGMVDLNTLSLDELWHALSAEQAMVTLLTLARAEDLGAIGDVTTKSIIKSGQRGRGEVIARGAGIAVGARAALGASRVFEADLTATFDRRDGDPIARGERFLAIDGCYADLLAMERTLLNVINHLSGIATLTRRYVDAIAGTRAAVCDTRKTTPGWRALEKYAVRCGGGVLHRVGLFDAALYKDNHIARLAPDEFGRAIARAARSARDEQPLRFVEVEVDRLDQLDQLLTHALDVIDIVLLDNFSIDDLRAAVARRDARAPSLLLEASGGVTLQTIRPIAETGVDRISVGALTHSAPAFDFGLDMLAH